jgi:glucosamine-6-phosphate deaminase
MSGLLAEVGIAYHLNIKMFNKLQHSITGWEGNLILKTNRPERSLPAKKKSYNFSPHPDDDVIHGYS